MDGQLLKQALLGSLGWLNAHQEEINRLIGKVEQKGFTLVPLNLHYKGSYVKADIALAKGKAQHDKRETEKKRDWEREKGRLMRHKVSGPSGS